MCKHLIVIVANYDCRDFPLRYRSAGHLSVVLDRVPSSSFIIVNVADGPCLAELQLRTAFLMRIRYYGEFGILHYVDS